MYYKIIEKKSLLDSKHEIKQNELIKDSLNHQSNLLDNFLEENDSQVKNIHLNQEVIKKDLDVLFKHCDSISKISKESSKIYDEFIEYMKEAGDLYNYSNILSEEIDLLHEKLIVHYTQNTSK